MRHITRVLLTALVAACTPADPPAPDAALVDTAATSTSMNAESLPDLVSQIRAVDPNAIYRTNAIPNDPLFPQQQWLENTATGRTLVFARTKHGADKIVKHLERSSSSGLMGGVNRSS